MAQRGLGVVTGDVGRGSAGRAYLSRLWCRVHWWRLRGGEHHRGRLPGGEGGLRMRERERMRGVGLRRRGGEEEKRSDPTTTKVTD